MSTYYYFHCKKHEVSGGCWTRQAWGWGNANLIEAFKFVMFHVSECGPEHIGMHSEYDDDDWPNISYEDGARRQFLTETEHIFPHSDDWEWMSAFLTGTDFKKAWVQKELNEIEADKYHPPEEPR